MSNILSLYNLRANPFRSMPTRQTQEIVWAGFPELKQQIAEKIQFANQQSNSSLCLNWGHYGAGKTHAANYFSCKHVLDTLQSSTGATPYSLVINFPTGKNPYIDIFTKIIDNVDIPLLREQFRPYRDILNAYIDNNIRSGFIRILLKMVFGSEDLSIDLFSDRIDVRTIKMYLYNTISAKDFSLLKQYNILRKFETDEDYTDFISSLFSCLTFEQKVYSSIVLWIDEFEKINTLNFINNEKSNTFIRELLDGSPEHLLIFMNFTLSPLARVTDLGQYLSGAVHSRLRNKIEFASPKDTQIKIYLKEILEAYKQNYNIDNVYLPFTEECIDTIISELKSVPIRDYNTTFSNLLEIGVQQLQTILDKDFFNKYRKEVIWK